MGKVAIGFSMSLDGFVAGPHDEVDRVFQWYVTGETGHTVSAGDQEFNMNESAAESIEEAGKATGALVTGRRTFDIAHAWGGKHPMDVPVVVVTHNIPQEWMKEGSPFTFVTDGVQHALAAAQRIAGDKGVAVGAPKIAQQCLKAGLIDEIQIDLVPVLLGEGIRLFDNLGDAPIELECTNITPGNGVIHMTFRVTKKA